VFGGMGSWNDQGLDGEEFDSVSVEMFQALKEFTIYGINT
jgi:hypothetical protein